MRTDPKSFIPVLEERLGNMKGKTLVRKGKPDLMTKEGAKAIKEAISFLKKQKALGKLKLSKELCYAAQDHAQDSGDNDMRGHKGSDGCTLTDRVKRYCKVSGCIGENISYRVGNGMETVLRLVVDDGVASRGHRNNIFNSSFELIGVGLYKHPTWDNLVVLDYGAGLTPLGDKSKKLPSKSYKTYKPVEEESKVVPDSDDVKLEDCPKYFQKFVISKKLKDGEYKIKVEDGKYYLVTLSKVPRFMPKSIAKSPQKSIRKTSKSPTKVALGGGTPTNYKSKKVNTKIIRCGGQKTTKTTTTYTFW
eukprot:CAMPEP_0197002582 /NCGR_PEP_ID=MMETSP1380-20130617/7049_1 /TAXON_ID=5936 /ORGANISM="Euplotes crassus, Strain CT5" /LENGTH=304 /DNA_ID=CAMNT_0042420771 /DNA_START=64 /DNA_END=975 /DNA_ORIENTATION=+